MEFVELSVPLISMASILQVSLLQWNLSITATIGEQHEVRYTGVAVVEGFVFEMFKCLF